MNKLIITPMWKENFFSWEREMVLRRCALENWATFRFDWLIGPGQTKISNVHTALLLGSFFYNFFTLVCVCLVNIYTKWINILGILFLSLSFVLSPSLSMVMIMALRGMDEMLNIDPVWGVLFLFINLLLLLLPNKH